MTEIIHDVIGVGFGPANIALAIAFEEMGWPGKVLFLERNGAASWQPNMMLDGSDTQNNPLRDLVTPRNPRSRYSFTNYLHENNLLFEYLNLGLAHPLRKDYALYVTWVARHFEKMVRYNTHVTRIVPVIDAAGNDLFVLTAEDGSLFKARSVVVAPGRTPNIPSAFDSQLGERVFHLNDFLPKLEILAGRQPLREICVVGSSQSAIEIVLHLADRLKSTNVTNIMRSFGYRLKDVSPFSERVYFPEFVDYYFNLSFEAKRKINESLRLTNYSSADMDVIHRLNLLMYEQLRDGESRVRLQTNHRIDAVKLDGDKVRIASTDVHLNDSKDQAFDCVVLATGFRNFGVAEGEEACPPLLALFADKLAFGAQGFLHVNRDYSLSPRLGTGALPPLFLNGLCEASHGLGDAGSFSLLALRSWEIASSLATRLQFAEPRDHAMRRAGNGALDLSIRNGNHPAVARHLQAVDGALR